MYTLNKVSTLLPLVLITSYCVGTSTPLLFILETQNKISIKNVSIFNNYPNLSS